MQRKIRFFFVFSSESTFETIVSKVRISEKKTKYNLSFLRVSTFAEEKVWLVENNCNGTFLFVLLQQTN